MFICAITALWYLSTLFSISLSLCCYDPNPCLTRPSHSPLESAPCNLSDDVWLKLEQSKLWVSMVYLTIKNVLVKAKICFVRGQRTSQFFYFSELYVADSMESAFIFDIRCSLSIFVGIWLQSLCRVILSCSCPIYLSYYLQPNVHAVFILPHCVPNLNIKRQTWKTKVKDVATLGGDKCGENLPFSPELSMVVIRWVSWDLPSPQRHPHNGVSDSHHHQGQHVHQNRHYDMIPSNVGEKKRQDWISLN